MRFYLLFAVVYFLAFPVAVMSQGSFFWSQAGFGEGAVNQDLIVGVIPGESGRLSLYYSPNGQNISDGIDLNLSLDSDAITFQNAGTFEYDITITGIPIGQRWGDYAGPAQQVTDDYIEGLLAFNIVNGTGIQTANIPPGSPFTDEGYDETAGAFLIGFVDWQSESFGFTNLIVEQALVVDQGVALTPTFNQVFFQAATIPEPTFVPIIASILLLCGNHRRRI